MGPTPNIAQKGPFQVEVEAGKTYAWCACGRSSNQPFCDGSHKETPFTPVIHKPDKSGTEALAQREFWGRFLKCQG